MTNDNSRADDETINSRPVPKRPRWGWLAWESTVGYIATHHNPDVTLRLQIQPYAEIISFSASLVWGNQREETALHHDIAIAFQNLWDQINRNHSIFLQPEAGFRSPIGYKDTEWFDEITDEVFLRLMRVAASLFLNDWSIIILYRPSDIPENRLQMRLLQTDQAQRMVQCPTLRDACRQMLRHCVTIHGNRHQP